MSYRRWHRVLAHALLGVDLVELGEQTTPDLDHVVAVLTERQSQVHACRARAAAAGRPWPAPPTGQIADGLPWSQYLTLVHQLRGRLGLVGAVVAPPRGGAVEDRETQRLRADRPPHW